MNDWQHVIYFSDLSEGTGLKFDDRVAIAQRFRESSWARKAAETPFSDLAAYLEELEEVEDVQSFAMVMVAIYDEADHGKACFIDTMSPMPQEVNG